MMRNWTPELGFFVSAVASVVVATEVACQDGFVPIRARIVSAANDSYPPPYGVTLQSRIDRSTVWKAELPTDENGEFFANLPRRAFTDGLAFVDVVVARGLRDQRMIWFPRQASDRPDVLRLAAPVASWRVENLRGAQIPQDSVLLLLGQDHIGRTVVLSREKWNGLDDVTLLSHAHAWSQLLNHAGSVCLVVLVNGSVRALHDIGDVNCALQGGSLVLDEGDLCREAQLEEPGRTETDLVVVIDRPVRAAYKAQLNERGAILIPVGAKACRVLRGSGSDQGPVREWSLERDSWTLQHRERLRRSVHVRVTSSLSDPGSLEVHTRPALAHTHYVRCDLPTHRVSLGAAASVSVPVSDTDVIELWAHGGRRPIAVQYPATSRDEYEFAGESGGRLWIRLAFSDAFSAPDFLGSVSVALLPTGGGARRVFKLGSYSARTPTVAYGDYLLLIYAEPGWCWLGQVTVDQPLVPLRPELEPMLLLQGRIEREGRPANGVLVRPSLASGMNWCWAVSGSSGFFFLPLPPWAQDPFPLDVLPGGGGQRGYQGSELSGNSGYSDSIVGPREWRWPWVR